MERRPAKLTVFDVDGTLLPDNPDEISGRAFWELNKRGIFTSSDEKLQELWDLREQYATSPDFERQKYLTPMIIEFDEQMKGRPVKEIKQVAEDLAELDIAERLYPAMIEEIGQQREDGAHLAIISGSPDTFIQPLKHRLNFDFATGTRHFHNRKEYHSTKGVRSRGKEKEHIAKRWCEKISNELGRQATISAAYGDTMNDFSLLLEAEDPVAVNPKPDLAAEAMRRGWRMIYARDADLEFKLAQPVEEWHHDKYDLTDSHAV